MGPAWPSKRCKTYLELQVSIAKQETAYFGGGCFWCLEAALRALPGVTLVTSGYSGGKAPNPSYDEVCSGTTGHAEVVKVEFDPRTVTYDDLLKLFYIIHDPSQPNRQGNDVGAQYRSIILYMSEKQRQEAADYIVGLKESGKYPDVVTDIVPFDVFYPAEEYHQRYFEKHPEAAYCQLIIRPKVEKVTGYINGKTDK
jgi:peptide-methionine (S)-S-oxide reductase